MSKYYLVAVLAALSTTSCAAFRSNDGGTERAPKISASQKAYVDRQVNGTGQAQSYAASTSTADVASRLAVLERENASLLSTNASLETQLREVRVASTTKTSSIGGNADLPPAKPGECYARILIPATYKTTTEQVVDTEASERLEVIPAKYDFVEERILVKEASQRLEVIPATYRTVTETVMVQPATEEIRSVPAKYRNVTERVLVREGYTTWKKGEGPIGGSYAGGRITDTRETATGEIMCLVEVPAEYRTVTKRVLVEPARTSSVTIPAKTTTVQKRVIDRPATTRPVSIPAEYKTVRVRRLVTPASTRSITIPASYKTLTRQSKVTDEKLVWREVLCETNTTPDIVRRVQVALNKNGFKLATDGVLGPQTMRAIDAYQRRNNLGTGGLTLATAKKLGVM